jgi:hypothetical protein
MDVKQVHDINAAVIKSSKELNGEARIDSK